MLAEHVWGIDFDPESNVIDVYVGYLRRKVDLPGEARLVHDGEERATCCGRSRDVWAQGTRPRARLTLWYWGVLLVVLAPVSARLSYAALRWTLLRDVDSTLLGRGAGRAGHRLPARAADGIPRRGSATSSGRTSTTASSSCSIPRARSRRGASDAPPGRFPLSSGGARQRAARPARPSRRWALRTARRRAS